MAEPVVFRSTLEHVPLRLVKATDPRLHQLATNEDFNDPLPSVVETLLRELTTINRYPDDRAVELTGALADFLAVPEDHVVVGSGSLGLCQQLFSALGERGTNMVFPWRSFDAYPRLIQLSEASPRPIPLRDEANDLGAMAAAVDENTRMVLVCNPNNPTGPAVGSAGLRTFLDAVPPTVLVLLDEAYFEYVRDPEVPNGIDLYRDRPNVAVMRTFSKAYGLAALRVGYLVAHPEVTNAVRKSHITYGVNRLGQAAAITSLAAGCELKSRTDTAVFERERVHGELVKQGWRVPLSQGNFLWLRLGELSEDFGRHCTQGGLGIKVFPGEGVRVTIGAAGSNDLFLDLAARFRRSGVVRRSRSADHSRTGCEVRPAGSRRNVHRR